MIDFANWQAMWAALQQAAWIAYGPMVLWLLGGAIAVVVGLSALDLIAGLLRKYTG